MQVTCRLVE